MRKISFLLVLVLIASLILPVSAEVEPFVWDDLIEQGYVLRSSHHFNANTSFSIALSAAKATTFNKAQFFFVADSSGSYTVMFDNYPATVTYLYNGVWCADLDRNWTLIPNSTITITSSVRTTLDIYTLRGSRFVVGAMPDEFGISAGLSFVSLNGVRRTVKSMQSVTVTSAYNMLGSPNGGTDPDASYDATYYFYPNPGLDFITCDFLVSAYGVSNVSVDGSFPLDYTVSSPDVNGSTNDYRISLSIDIRNRSTLNSSTNPVVVHVQGPLGGHSCSITLSAGWCGWVVPSDFSNANWFYRIFGGFNNVVDALNTGFTNVSNWISAQTSSIINSISGNFVNLHDWLKNYTGQITSRLDSLINGNTSASDSFNQAVSDAQNDIDSANAVIDSFDRPDPDSIVVSLDTIVSPSEMLIAARLFSPVFENGLLGNIFLISLTLALVSYVIFGKKG